MTATDEPNTGARRHPGRGAVRAAIAVRRDLSAAADRRPRRRPGACPATAPDRQPRAYRAGPSAGTSITVAFTYTGLQALGVPQASLDSFAPEFREGMAARAGILGDTGESSPEHWEKPLGTGEVHVAIAALSPDPARTARRRRKGMARTGRAPGSRADLATGVLPAADRPDLVRVQGRDRPARGRRQRATLVEPEGAAAQGRRDHPRLPR